MKPENEALAVTRLRHRRLNRNISLSLRIAAIAHDRSLLRWLRAAESFARQDADALRQPQSGLATTRIEGPFNPLETADCEKR